MKSNDRRESILKAAYGLSQLPGGWVGLTRLQVARQAQCAEGLINRYFGTVKSLKDEVIKKAISEGNISIIKQGQACNNFYAKKVKV